MAEELNHFDSKGNAVMVDVSDKEETTRTAVARGKIQVNDAVMQAVVKGGAKKGDVLNVARIAGIMGAKQTSSLIPMCHLLMINTCSIDFELCPESNQITAVCTVKTKGATGVEMEALTGVSVALLTIYDMCKAMDRAMEIREIYLLEKLGGKSGHYRHTEN